MFGVVVVVVVAVVVVAVVVVPAVAVAVVAFIKAKKRFQKCKKCCILQGFGAVTGKKLRKYQRFGVQESEV